MTSTGCCRDQDAVVCHVPVPRGRTVKALGDDHGNLELYSMPLESMKVACSPISDSQLR